MKKLARKKSFTTVALCIGIICPAAFLFSLTADLPHVLIITLVGLLFSLLTRKIVKFSERTIIYSVVISLVMTVLFDYVFPMGDDRFEFLSSLFRLHITIPFIFYLAVAVTFFDSKKHSYAMASIAAVIALAFGGNVLRTPIQTERFLIVDAVLQNFMVVYISSISLSCFFILLACRDNAQITIKRKMRKYRLRKILILAIIMVLIIPASYGFYELFQRFEGKIRSLQNTLLSSGLLRNNNGKTVFGESADLNQVISLEILNNQEKIVIRAICSSEPGYLRGKAYTFYSKGRWEQLEDPKITIMRQRDNNGSAYRTFSITKEKKTKHSIEILVSSKLVSKVLFTPGNFTQIDIIADSLKYTENGNVTFEDWVTDGGYTVYRPRELSDSAWQKPRKLSAGACTQLPNNLIGELDLILKTLPKLKNLELNDQQRIGILLKYFQDNFTYKIRKQPVNPIDPILSFLKDTHQGHCELYATSMALLLRRLGIPTRYISGFVCSERHPMGAYYVARLGNAHAWVEAFDRDKGEWVLVEPTPPSGAPNYKHDWSTFESWTDLFKKAFQQLLSNLRRGYFAQAIIDFFVAIWQVIVLICYHWIRGPVLALLFIGITIFYIHRRRKRRMVKHHFDRPEEMFIELGRIYQKLQKQLKTKYELNLSVSSTINDFIIELSKSDMAESQKTSLIKLLREYEAMRYLKTPPSEEVYLDFKKRFHL